MVAGLSTGMLLLVAAVVLTGGVVKGLAGFGYALASTAVLAMLLSPKLAVALMVAPVLAANLSLVGDIERRSLLSCVGRFKLYIGSAVAGTLVGTLLIAHVPANPFRVGLGLLALAFVALQHLDMDVGSAVADDGPVSAAVGAVSGFVFGLSNVGLQFVLFLESRDVDRSLFVALLAILMVGVSAVRLGIVVLSQLSSSIVILSLALALPGLVGTAIGSRLRHTVEEALVERIVRIILIVAGLKLVLGGLGIV